MAQLLNLQVNDFVKERWDYIITVFARVSAGMSMRRMTSSLKSAQTLSMSREAGFAPGYSSLLLGDPDGTRLEINHVPGKGLLAPGMQIGGGYVDGTQT